MEITKGMFFTSTQFKGVTEVLSVDADNNRIKVLITALETSSWEEEWSLQHTIWGFERGDYNLFDKDDKLMPIYQSMALYINKDVAKAIKQIRVKEGNSLKNTLFLITEKYPDFKKFVVGNNHECTINGMVLVESAMVLLNEVSKEW
jgi:hypothetical protein